MEKSEILRENEVDIKLKDYFKKLIDMVGYDYALVSLSTEDDIKDSISSFSSQFDEVTNMELTISLLRSNIISGDSNNEFVKRLLASQNFEDLIFLVNHNFGIRRAMTREFMNHCYESNESTYEKRNNKKNALRQLENLKLFEQKINKENQVALAKRKGTR